MQESNNRECKAARACPRELGVGRSCISFGGDLCSHTACRTLHVIESAKRALRMRSACRGNSGQGYGARGVGHVRAEIVEFLQSDISLASRYPPDVRIAYAHYVTSQVQKPVEHVLALAVHRLRG